MRGFFLLPVLWQAPPPRHRHGDFSFPAAENRQRKKHTFFHGRGAGQHKHKNRAHKNQRYDDDYQTFNFIRPCFSHTGPERGTCFFRGLSAAAFSSLLVFSQQCFPGVFHFPLFFAGICGGTKRRPNPRQQSLLWEYHPRFRPPDAPKNKWKNDGMTGKNKCPKQPKKQAPALLVKLRRSAGTPCQQKMGNQPKPIP